MKSCPPAVMVPVLVALELEATEKVTVPWPVPEATPCMLIQLTPLVAVQGHPVVVLMVTVLSPPMLSKDAFGGESA